MVAQIQGATGGAGQEGGGASLSAGETRARGLQGFDPAIRKEIEKQFGYDKPAWERFWLLLKGDATFHLGRSLFSRIPVSTLIWEKLPVSDLARGLDDAALLPDLDPARHPQGGARRFALRRRHLARRVHRLRHSELPLGGSAGDAVLLGQLPAVSAARFDLRQFRPALAPRQGRRLPLAHRHACHRADARAPSPR